MIDFSAYKGWAIPEGVVTQIADEVGRVIWAVQSESGEPIVLEVEKITADTYAASTTYTGEQFVLLDIYPKTATSKVKVTYGDLTKTLTFSGTNAQQVYFGTFYGEADSVTTPASGTLTLEGGCAAIGRGTYKTGSKDSNTAACDCIIAIADSGGMEYIPTQAFYKTTGSSEALTRVNLSSGLTSIGEYAFRGCDGLKSVTVQSGAIGAGAFQYCDGLASLTLAEGVTSIGIYAFEECKALTSVMIPSSVTNWETYAFKNCTALKSVIVNSAIIGAYAFYFCDALTNVVLPEGLTSIGECAFVTTEEGVLANITIPSTVTYIGDYVFGANNRATPITVTMLPTTPPVVGEAGSGSGIFGSKDTNVTIIVPKGCGAVYKATAGWSRYADCITEAS